MTGNVAFLMIGGEGEQRANWVTNMNLPYMQVLMLIIRVRLERVLKATHRDHKNHICSGQSSIARRFLRWSTDFMEKVNLSRQFSSIVFSVYL